MNDMLAAFLLLMKAYYKIEYKREVVFTKDTTFLQKDIDSAMELQRNWGMYYYCAEDREAMTHQNQDWINDLAVDRAANDEADGKVIMLNQRLKNK